MSFLPQRTEEVEIKKRMWNVKQQYPIPLPINTDSQGSKLTFSFRSQLATNGKILVARS